MRIKKYIAGNVTEALSKIKNDMGTDAVILNTRNLGQKSVYGRSSGVEVTAASDYPQKPLRISADDHPISNSIRPIDPEIKKQPEYNYCCGPNEDVQRVNEMLNAELSGVTTDQYLQFIPPEISQLYRKLPDLNIDPAIVDGMVKNTLSGNLPGDPDSPVKGRWARYLSGRCNSTASIEKEIGKRPLAFSGFPGCGRSTLIAKIAFGCIKDKKCPVSIVSFDRYNVSGQHQLRRIAKLLNAKFIATTKLNEVDQRIGKFNPGEALLIDLPSIDTSDESEKEILERIKSLPVTRILVLDVSRHYRHVDDVLDRLNLLEPDALAATHLFEIPGSGALVYALIKSKLKPLVGGRGRGITGGYETLRIKSICERLLSLISLEDADD